MRRVTSFIRRQDGMAAVELSLMLPVFALIIAGIVDVGSGVYMKTRLNSAVSGASTYALMNASKVNATDAATLANTLASATWASGRTATIVVNNAITAVRTGAGTTTGGTPGNANSCWCPTRSGDTVTWGSAVTCGGACPSGGTAGKFVSIQLQAPYSAMVSSYGLVGSTLKSSAVVRLQ